MVNKWLRIVYDNHHEDPTAKRALLWAGNDIPALIANTWIHIYIICHKQNTVYAVISNIINIQENVNKQTNERTNKQTNKNNDDSAWVARMKKL